MDLNWMQSILYGLVSGLTDILPVSARAHQVLLEKFFGISGNEGWMDLIIHLAILGALYFSSQSQIIRFSRARALARVPKRRRKRPLDVRTLMDMSMLKTMLVPAFLGLVCYQFTRDMASNLMLVSVCLFINGIILYIPQFFPTANRDSRTLSRLEGLLMGLGGAASIFPGISAIGAAVSLGSICGVERGYALNMALLLQMILEAGFLVYDVIGLFAGGAGMLSFSIFLRMILTGAVAFSASLLAIRLMRYLASNHSFSLFGLYCMGLSLFTFILNLMA